jgi:hypothetical protein
MQTPESPGQPVPSTGTHHELSSKQQRNWKTLINDIRSRAKEFSKFEFLFGFVSGTAGPVALAFEQYGLAELFFFLAAFLSAVWILLRQRRLWAGLILCIFPVGITVYFAALAESKRAAIAQPSVLDVFMSETQRVDGYFTGRDMHALVPVSNGELQEVSYFCGTRYSYGNHSKALMLYVPDSVPEYNLLMTLPRSPLECDFFDQILRGQKGDQSESFTEIPFSGHVDIYMRRALRSQEKADIETAFLNPNVGATDVVFHGQQDADEAYLEIKAGQIPPLPRYRENLGQTHVFDPMPTPTSFWPWWVLHPFASSQPEREKETIAEAMKRMGISAR